MLLHLFSKGNKYVTDCSRYHSTKEDPDRPSISLADTLGIKEEGPETSSEDTFNPIGTGCPPNQSTHDVRASCAMEAEELKAMKKSSASSPVADKQVRFLNLFCKLFRLRFRFKFAFMLFAHWH